MGVGVFAQLWLCAQRPAGALVVGDGGGCARGGMGHAPQVWHEWVGGEEALMPAWLGLAVLDACTFLSWEESCMMRVRGLSGGFFSRSLHLCMDRMGFIRDFVLYM